MADRKTGEMQPERVGQRAFRAKLTHYLGEVRQGRAFAVTAHGRVIAEIHPPSTPEPPPRRPGALKGRIRLADDAGLPRGDDA